VDSEVQANDIKTMCDQPDCPVAGCCYRFMQEPPLGGMPVRTYRWYFDGRDDTRGYGGGCDDFVEIVPGDELRR